MSSGIFYNQSVTADDLNEIAIDLGLSSFSGFGTEKFGAEELNNITKDLVGKGYLNAGNKCKPLVSTDGKLTVLDGIAVFSDGAKLVLKNSKTYSFDARGKAIYFKHDISNGRVTLNYRSAFPSGDDYVPLCEVLSDGTVIDKRTLAVAKVSINAAEKNKTEKAEGSFMGKHYEWTFAGTLELAYSGYNVVYVENANSGYTKWLALPDTGETEYTRVGFIRVKFARCAEGLAVYAYGCSDNTPSETATVKVTLY